MNDGLDGRETIAFGLATGEVAAFVLALMTAYALLRSGLPGAIGWLMAVLVAAGGALLAWGRLAGRPLLEWAVLLAAFVVRTGPARAGRVRERVRRCTAALQARAATARLHVLPRVAAAAPGQGGAVVIPLALRPPQVSRARPDNAPARPSRTRSHVVGFFSLAGGTGRTTLAVEVAATLAVRGRAAAATGELRTRVLLIDLGRRNPAVGLRLGLAPPSGSSHVLATHASGLLVAVAPASASPYEQTPAYPSALIESVRADVVFLDFDCDLGDGCRDLLARCDQVLVTTTPTAAGVLAAYRGTALLRRLGMRERIGHVINRSRPGVELGEVMADLGGAMVAAIPDDHGFVTAEDLHRLAGLVAEAETVAALGRLATHIELHAGAARTAAAGPRWGSHAG